MTREELFNAFKVAIDKEQEAFEFYSALAKKITENKELKVLFENFARQESTHLQAFKDLYANLRGDEK